MDPSGWRRDTRLMIDDAAIERSTGLVRTCHRPEKTPGGPVLRGDRPWERGTTYPHCVIHDAESRTFHAWYRAVDAPNGTPGGRESACYARSTDGVNWEKPVIGEIEYDGSTRNNIIAARTPIAVMANRGTIPSARKLIGFWSGEKPFSLSFRASDDGIHWEPIALPQAGVGLPQAGVGIPDTGDLRRSAEETPPTSRPRYFTTDQCWSGSNAWGAAKRGVMRCESDDLRAWGGRRVIFGGDPEEPVNLEYYTMHAVGRRASDTYAGIYLGFLHCFHTDIRGRRNPVNHAAMSGTIDVALVLSPDTVSWRKLDESRAFLPCGPDGDFDSGMVFVSSMVVFEDELLFPYSGWNIEHGQLTDTPERIGRADMGIARLRMDGFASVEPSDLYGTLTTRPLERFDGTLEVNADASRGEIRMEVVRDDGSTVPGFAADDCETIVSDSVRHRVSWRGTRVPAVVTHEGVRLRFHLRGRSRLYSYTVNRREDDAANS